MATFNWSIYNDNNTWDNSADAKDLTLAPASARPFAISRPIPRAPPMYALLACQRKRKPFTFFQISVVPVTAATLPVKSKALRTCLFSGCDKTIFAGYQV